MIDNRQTADSMRNDDGIALRQIVFKIREIAGYLFTKWRFVFAAAIIGIAVGFFISNSKKATYLAETTFVLEDDSGSGSMLGQLGGLAGLAGYDIGGGSGGIFKGDNILELYKSRKMIEKTLMSKVKVGNDSLVLLDRFIRVYNLQEKWALRKNGITSEKDARLKDSIVNLAVLRINRDHLEVAKPDKKLSIIRVAVRSVDEVFSMHFNEQLVQNVNDFYVQTKTKKSLDNVLILQQKADSVKAVMNGALYQTIAIADATPNLNSSRQVQRLPMQRAQVSVETNKAILGELVKNLEMAKMSLLQETPLIQVIDRPIYPLKTEQPNKIALIVVSGLVATFLACLVLIIRLILKEILVVQ